MKSQDPGSSQFQQKALSQACVLRVQKAGPLVSVHAYGGIEGGGLGGKGGEGGLVNRGEHRECMDWGYNLPVPSWRRVMDAMSNLTSAHAPAVWPRLCIDAHIGVAMIELHTRLQEHPRLKCGI